MKTVIALTGASGSLFGVEFLRRCPGEKILILSKWGKSVLYQETGLTPADLAEHVTQIYSNEDMNAPVASGSNSFDQVVILPCSMSTLGRIANGIGENLISRVGEVALKESRRMVLGLRETPLSPIALENALRLSRAGVTIMPVSPAFYLKPAGVDAMAADFAEHVLASLHLPHRPGWRAEKTL